MDCNDNVQTGAWFPAARGFFYCKSLFPLHSGRTKLKELSEVKRPMLLIRKEQMQIFGERADRLFVCSVAELLRSKHADLVEDLTGDELTKRVAYGIRKAKRHGLTWQSNLSAFVILMFTVAPNFDELKLFNLYFSKQGIHPNLKMKKLLRNTTGPDWKQAKETLTNTSEWPL